jgi:hypothetical protein
MYTVTTDRREITLQASSRKGAVHAAVMQLASGERVVTVRAA